MRHRTFASARRGGRRCTTQTSVWKSGDVGDGGGRVKSGERAIPVNSDFLCRSGRSVAAVRRAVSPSRGISRGAHERPRRRPDRLRLRRSPWPAVFPPDRFHQLSRCLGQWHIRIVLDIADGGAHDDRQARKRERSLFGKLVKVAFFLFNALMLTCRLAVFASCRGCSRAAISRRRERFLRLRLRSNRTVA